MKTETDLIREIISDAKAGADWSVTVHINRIRKQARLSALEDATNALDALRHSKECTDNWSITRQMAFQDCMVCVTKLISTTE